MARLAWNLSVCNCLLETSVAGRAPQIAADSCCSLWFAWLEVSRPVRVDGPGWAVGRTSVARRAAAPGRPTLLEGSIAFYVTSEVTVILYNLKESGVKK